MRRIAFYLSLTALAMVMANCGNLKEKNTTEATKIEVVETAKVLVYYFHSKQRCKTCMAIQNLAAETIASNYSDNEDVKFIELDFSEKANEAIAEKYQVAGSSLIIVSGEAQTNLTGLAFANALRNPEVLKNALVDGVNTLLTK